MIKWLIAPEFLGDAKLLAEYHRTDGEGDRASALLAEIERRGLECDGTGSRQSA